MRSYTFNIQATCLAVVAMEPRHVAEMSCPHSNVVVVVVAAAAAAAVVVCVVWPPRASCQSDPAVPRSASMSATRMQIAVIVAVVEISLLRTRAMLMRRGSQSPTCNWPCA